MKRTSVCRRSQRMRVIKRKVHLLKQYGGDNFVFTWSHRGETGRFSKGKIHCSYRMRGHKSCDIFPYADRKKFLSVQKQINEINYGRALGNTYYPLKYPVVYVLKEV